MNEIISVDIGHLISERDKLNFISLSDFNALENKYGHVFKEFQMSLQGKKSYLTLSLEEERSIPAIKSLAKNIAAKYENVLVLGIGGSALGARAVIQYLKGPLYNLIQQEHPRLFILDNIDPVLVKYYEDVIDIGKTLIIYVSKSGSTPETAALFIHFYHRFKEAGGDTADIVICCDPGDNGINHIAKSLGCRLLHIPHNLPGRYSVLSSVGFLPSEIIGIDSGQLLEGAHIAHQSIISDGPQQNALFALGASLFELALKGKSIHVLFNYSNLLSEFGLWFVQLWAESLGKKQSLANNVVNAGTTPLTCLGATDQHSILQLFKEGPADKVFGFMKINNVADGIQFTNEFPTEKEYSYFAGRTMQEQLHVEQLATEMSLVKDGKPCYSITLKDVSPKTLGGLFYFFEALVVFTANLWDINAYDQPGVEEGKNITYSLMGRQDYNHKKSKYEQEVSMYNAERRIYSI
ncbi:Glucose-6-phosphate isomerase [Pelotomaculum schinkii]|uniref:Glucose-6-phosphate isomerase n=1 Tax=Pelotomaculum schinkii TaxID=78350 RepID=A0A4Y7R5W3_9FIRM|nr:glucose-6-phosphate isomerase [Pelotomaculum schinkii]TEB04335.1 Glucose-6-phosphate isomerase [Pelotomaculum schinkii]